MAVNNRKVAIVGCGRSGSAVSFALMQSGLFSEMVLIDSLAGRADRVALDLAYGISFTKSMNIYAGGYDDLADAVFRLADPVVQVRLRDPGARQRAFCFVYHALRCGRARLVPHRPCAF